MLELARIFGRIALLMGKPYEVPDQPRVLQLALVFALCSYVAASLPMVGWPQALWHAILDVSLSAAALWAGLHLVGKANRFRQAYAALCGASSYINIAALPVVLSSAAANRLPDGDAAPPSLAHEVAQFVFLVWGISLLAHVIRFSFDTNIPASIAAAVAYILLAVSVFAWLFGAG